MWKNTCKNVNGTDGNRIYKRLRCAIVLALKLEFSFVSENLSDNEAKLKEKQSGYNVIYNRLQKQFSVNCALAHKGLFSGILVLATTIISLIMFFELISYREYKDAAIEQVQLSYYSFINLLKQF